MELFTDALRDDTVLDSSLFALEPPRPFLPVLLADLEFSSMVHERIGPLLADSATIDQTLPH